MNITVVVGKEKRKFGVGRLPGRKNKALYYYRGCQVEPLAWFRCNEDAVVFERILEFIGTAVKFNASLGGSRA